jgi:preprotein translocase subunit SecG
VITLLYTIHIFLCIALALIVLIQAGKGSGVGLSIGGGMSQTMFGGSGGKTFFMKITIGIAVAFMITCMSLAYLATKGAGGYHGVLSGTETQAAPPAQTQPQGVPSMPATVPSEPKAAPRPAPKK